MANYVTNEEICNILGWDVSDDTLTDDLDIVVPYIEDLVDAYCNTSFVEDVASTKYYSGLGNDVLDLRWYYTTITSIEVVDSDGTVIRTYTSDEYRAMPLASRKPGYFYIQTTSAQDEFPKGLGNIKVVGDIGWETANIPREIKMAVAIAVKHFYQSRDVNEFYEYDSSLNRNTTLFEKIKHLPRQSQLVLDKWKFIPVNFEL